MNTRIALGAGTLALLIGALGPWVTFLGEWGALLAPGWGLYLTVIVGVFLIASTWLVRRPEPAVA
jgi:hypothetical protein